MLRSGKGSSGERASSTILSQVIVRSGCRTHLSRAAIKRCKYPTVRNTTEIFAGKKQRNVQMMDLIIKKLHPARQGSNLTHLKHTLPHQNDEVCYYSLDPRTLICTMELWDYLLSPGWSLCGGDAEQGQQLRLCGVEG